MKAFADLYTALDETTKTNDKVAALARYLASASPADAAWAVYFLVGRKPRQVVGTRKLRDWAAEEAGVPPGCSTSRTTPWATCPRPSPCSCPRPNARPTCPLAYWVEDRLLPLKDEVEPAQKAAVLAAWRAMDDRQRFVWNKLISGAFRVGVSAQLVTRALAKVTGVESSVVAHRLMGDWKPTPEFYDSLRMPPTPATPTDRGPTRSAWRTPWRPNPRHSATLRSGRRSGSGTASARS